MKLKHKTFALDFTSWENEMKFLELSVHRIYKQENDCNKHAITNCWKDFCFSFSELSNEIQAMIWPFLCPRERKRHKKFVIVVEHSISEIFVA